MGGEEVQLSIEYRARREFAAIRNLPVGIGPAPVLRFKGKWGLSTAARFNSCRKIVQGP